MLNGFHVSLTILGGVLGMVMNHEQMRQLRAPRWLTLVMDTASAVLGALTGYALSASAW